MSAIGLSSRAIIGEFYRTLEQDVGASWIPQVSMLFQSDQESETYRWLGQSPAMREWVGGRHAKGFRENGLSISNLHYEATLEVLKRELMRDKTGQILVRVRELAQRANAHWARLLSTLIVNGTSTTCYDGQYFFDTDHVEGDSGSQSNDITVDISAMPAEEHGTVTNPSVAEMRISIIKGIQQIMSLVDDQGEPMNENASQFLVMVPISLLQQARDAVSAKYDSAMVTTTGLNIAVAANTRLSSWTDSFAVFRTDGNVKPFIRQEETGVELKVIGAGSELEFNEDKHRYGIDTWRNVGYGYWQHACYVQMT
jgi:phage major head subunit gpT-like protein